MKPRVAWYTPQVLPYSQTFVTNQLAALGDEIDSLLIGVETVPDIPPPANTWVLESDAPYARFHTLLFKATRFSPVLRSALRDFSPSVLIAHFLQCGWRVSKMARSTRVPLAVMCHGSDVLTLHGPKRGKAWSARRLTANWQRFTEETAFFLAASEYLGSRLLEAGVPPSKLAVHYIGVPIPEETALGGAGARSGVLFIGRLVENKGCAHLLSAVAEISRSRRVEVTVVGDGPERQALERQAGQLPSGAKVCFAGKLTQQEVSFLITQHRLVCVPSTEVASGASEGLGLVACEAAAHGRPVVAFDTGGLRETLIHGVTGLLVPPKNITELAEALHAVLTDDATAESLGRAGRKFATDHFDVEVQSRRLMELLAARNLISGGLPEEVWQA